MFKIMQGTTTESVVIMLNISLNTEISDDELLLVFQTGKVPDKWVQHICKFYNELHIEVIKAFVVENDITQSLFIDVYSQLPTYCENSNFINLLNTVYK